MIKYQSNGIQGHGESFSFNRVNIGIFVPLNDIEDKLSKVPRVHIRSDMSLFEI